MCDRRDSPKHTEQGNRYQLGPLSAHLSVRFFHFPGKGGALIAVACDCTYQEWSGQSATLYEGNDGLHPMNIGLKHASAEGEER